jgi:hypothetical protein
MVQKKTLLFSLVMALFLTAFTQTYNPVTFVGSGFSGGSQAAVPLTGNQLAAGIADVFILYLVLTGLIYLILCSILKGFGCI